MNTVFGRYVGSKGGKGRIDLLKEFENDDFLLIIHKVSDKNMKKILINISGFQVAYEDALSELK